MRTTRAARRGAPLAVTAALALALAACSGSDGTHSVSVFRVKPGQCFAAPKSVKVQLADLTRVDCTKPHTQEAYAVVPYTQNVGVASPSASTPAGSLPSVGGGAYPGEDVLTTFAQGACAQRYGPYVGRDYLDSSLFFTYLLPSARSWEQASDRTVLCFVTTTGGTLTRSVKNSKL